ncbi:polyprenol phosphomannose-dependent alpha 1,6 mannosyltransferase MptB [Actinoplanes bogorensis]|uniref:Polyprenol phosphomannose-dependent alpha 1,6 mannosyltransferase MptB n=1 Tax=Paractinoplanes bogorensis TaxID=1610840 RepID=A0ABS5Z840_9ACTN|nr:polyprenol phosphomannose-dependent alpha 1,6 mannosyltransferase MptB [Actinoplanes bogorensis]MBU2670650.1 polyprenol phosphomannose-dependent alpha 1,6 mannosyltransferase MptB [Actinoplanes bogorensis]
MPRPAVVRYAGLAGSVSLALAAWLGGATNPWQPTITPRTIFAGENGVLLPVAWLAGTALLIAAWIVGLRVEKTARWAYVTAALWMLPLLAFLPLGSYDAYSYACQGWQQSAGLDPYGGGVDLLGCPWADAVAPTWRDAPAPYGPLFLVLAGVAAKTGTLTGTLAGLRIIALLGVALIAVSLPVLARRGGVPVSRVVWLVLACPLVPIHLISGAHNDALMVGLMVAGLAVAVVGKRRAALLTGVLLGLAVAVKATAVVVVPFALLLLLDRRRRAAGPAIVGGDRAVDRAAAARQTEKADERYFGLRAGWRPAAVLVGGMVLATAAISLVSGRGLGWVTALSGSGVSVQWTSLPTAIGMTLELVGASGAVAVTRIVGIVVLAVLLVRLWWRAHERDALLYAGYALAATVLLAPVFHPWYAFWPLAVLAATMRTKLNWLVVPCAVAAALCLPDGYNLALAVKAQGAVAMTVFLAWMLVHEAKSWTAERRGAGHAPDRLSRRDT